MLMFVATMLMQGKRKNDFDYCAAGEILMPVFFSEHDGEPVDGKCGCRRSLIGLHSLKATTTFRVMPVPVPESALKAMVEWHLEKMMASPGALLVSKEQYKQRALASAKVLVAEASRHLVGSVLERRGDTFHVRAVLPLVPGDVIKRSSQGKAVFPGFQTCCFCDGYSRVVSEGNVVYGPLLAYEAALVRHGFWLNQCEGLVDRAAEQFPFPCRCNCEHSTKEEKVGRGLTRITCTKCKQSTTIDSSD